MASSPTQLPLALEHRPALSGEDFLVAPCNRAALAWLDRWPDWGAPGLVIYGEPGCGKTHLAEVFREVSGAHLCQSSELSIENLPNVINHDQPVVIVDQADGFLAQQGDSGEVVLFHLFNMARELGGHILFTAHKAPSSWAIKLADLRSRLSAIAAVEISAPDDALMEAVLVKLFSDRQLRIERDVIVYMLSRMERSFHEARELVGVLDHEALAAKRAITVPLVRSVLQQRQDREFEE